MSGRRTHSSRYVTSGYQNALHRAYLYGLGLSDRDLQQPFVGVAQCVNEARPEARALAGAYEIARDAIAAAAMTSRQFGVPVAAQENDVDDFIRARELAADSCELVVRGHWYDALVGVAATPASIFGVAQAICRLRIPGLVVVPRLTKAPAGTDEATAILEALGLAVRVSAETPLNDIASACRRIREEIDGTARVGRLDAALRHGALGSAAVPAALWPGLAALAHESGVVSLDDLGVDRPDGISDEAAVVAGIDYPGPVDSPLNYDVL